MGNAQNAKRRKSKQHNTLKEKIDKEIMESLGSKDNKESVNRFKEGMKRRLRAQRFLTSGFGKILNDENRTISTAHNLISSIFDSNINFEEHKNLVNNNFMNSHFLYNIIEEKNSENFYKEKIESLNSLLMKNFSQKNDEEIILTKSLEIVGKDSPSVKFSDVVSDNSYTNQNNTLKLSSKNNLRETLVNNIETSLRTSQALRTSESINRMSNKLNFENDKVLQSQGDYPLDTPEQFKKTQNDKLENSTFNLTPVNKEPIKTMNISLNVTRQNIENNSSTINKSQILPLDKSNIDNNTSNLNVKDRSLSKTKKRTYTKPPIVNIKINLKDFIKQDAIEKSFLSPTSGNQAKKKNEDSKRDLNITHISKDQNISNINDSSFVDIVDVFSDTKKEYIEVRKRKNLSKSKSPDRSFNQINTREVVKIRMNDDGNYNFNSYYQESRNKGDLDDRKNRIKYKQSDIEEDDSQHIADFGLNNQHRTMNNLKLVNKN
jgi:hypothetical protein